MNLIQLTFYENKNWQACLKKIEIELDLSTDKDMLLIVQKNEYKAKYFMQFIDMNNLDGWAMLQKLPVDRLNGEMMIKSLTLMKNL